MGEGKENGGEEIEDIRTDTARREEENKRGEKRRPSDESDLEGEKKRGKMSKTDEILADLVLQVKEMKEQQVKRSDVITHEGCLLYTSPSPRD